MINLGVVAAIRAVGVRGDPSGALLKVVGGCLKTPTNFIKFR